MARHPGLVRRSARWYLRSRVPADLVRFLRRDEIWRSLRTGDHREAVKRFRRARADLDTWFDAQRRRRDAGERAANEIPRLVAGWFHETERRAAHADFALFGDLLHDAVGEAEQELVELVDGGAEETVQAAVDRVLISAGWPVQAHRVGMIATKRTKVADGEVPAEIYDLTRRALIEMVRRRRERLRGSPNGVSFDPLFNGGVPTLQPVAENGEDSTGITLAELIKRFAADKAPRLSPGKVTEYQALFRLVKETWGESKSVREITRADCRAVRDLLAVLPPHAAQRWPGKPLAEVAEHAKAHGVAPMDPATGNAYLQRLSTLLRWAEREEYITKNPAVGLRMAEPEGDPRHARYPFSTEQLRKIFEGLAGEAPWRRWIALLGLFSGGRLNEICQLAVDDVTTMDGVPVILIRPDPENGARLKTANARRVMPAHGELVRCGLMKYVQEMRAAGHDRLFPELRLDSRGRYSDLYQKWFSRFLDKVGAKAPRTSYHSFRHGFRDSLRDAKIADELVDALCGWSRGTMRELYGSGPPIAALARAIRRVRYDIDLRHLHLR